MSGEVIGLTYVKKCRKNHSCFWCGETIERGSPYSWWLWVESGTIEKIKCHPECHDAWSDASEYEGDIYYCIPGEHERGTL